MAIVHGIRKVSDLLDRIMIAVAVVMLGAMVIITGAQIICRIFFTSLAWSEEATRYLLIWSTMLGAGCVYKHSGHISITLLQDAMPKAVRELMIIAVHLVCMVLFGVIFYNGVKYFGRQGSQLSAAMRLPMRYVYTCIPIGAAVMAFHALSMTLDHLMALLGKEAA
ncbi:MAG: TRAP transporter small permease [Clostridiales bacterium]|nr:TRAP transporter small permease [Clostridiales bacterium]